MRIVKLESGRAVYEPSGKTEEADCIRLVERGELEEVIVGERAYYGEPQTPAKKDAAE